MFCSCVNIILYIISYVVNNIVLRIDVLIIINILY